MYTWFKVGANGTYKTAQLWPTVCRWSRQSEANIHFLYKFKERECSHEALYLTPHLVKSGDDLLTDVSAASQCCQQMYGS